MAVAYGEKSVGKFITYLFTRSLFFSLSLIPFRLRAHMMGSLFVLLSKIIASNRKLVYRNIKAAFPEKDDEWIKKVSQKSYYNFGRQLACFIQNPRINEKFMRRWMVIKESDPSLYQCLDAGGIFILGHLGVWEWTPILMTFLSKTPAYGYTKRQSNPWVNQFMFKMRGGYGFHVIHTDESHKISIKALKSGAGLGFIADQAASVKDGGILINFLNRYAVTFSGPAVMAKLTKVPSYFYWSYLDEKNRVVSEIKPLPLPEVDPQQEPDKWIKIFTYNWVKELEKQIRNHPQDYFWMHNRWKRNFSDEEEQSAIQFWSEYEKGK